MLSVQAPPSADMPKPSCPVPSEVDQFLVEQGRELPWLGGVGRVLGDMVLLPNSF